MFGIGKKDTEREKAGRKNDLLEAEHRLDVVEARVDGLDERVDVFDDRLDVLQRRADREDAAEAADA